MVAFWKDVATKVGLVHLAAFYTGAYLLCRHRITRVHHG